MALVWVVCIPMNIYYILTQFTREVGELSQAMRNRALWHAIVADIPASDAEG